MRTAKVLEGSGTASRRSQRGSLQLTPLDSTICWTTSGSGPAQITLIPINVVRKSTRLNRIHFPFAAFPRTARKGRQVRWPETVMPADTFLRHSTRPGQVLFSFPSFPFPGTPMWGRGVTSPNRLDFFRILATSGRPNTLVFRIYSVVNEEEFQVVKMKKDDSGGIRLGVHLPQETREFG